MTYRAGIADPLVGIAVVTGFLGSGKTTLLNALLRDPQMRDTAVVINEFGDVGLDHLLVAQGSENVVLLDSGCLCCTISETLNKTLEDLFGQRERGDIPRFVRVVVETTGLADPGPILGILLGDYALSKLYSVRGVLAVADGIFGTTQLSEHPEAVNQIAFADRVAISKTDVAEYIGIARLRDAISRLNPTVSVTEGTLEPDGAVSSELVDFILQAGSHDDGAIEHAEFRGGHGEPGHAHHHSLVQSYTFLFDGPVSWQDYSSWLEGLRAFPASDLLRVKGMVEIGQAGRPYVIQGVRHMFTTPRRLDAWPSDDRRGRLVVIVRGIDRTALAGVFGRDATIRR